MEEGHSIARGTCTICAHLTLPAQDPPSQDHPTGATCPVCGWIDDVDVHAVHPRTISDANGCSLADARASYHRRGAARPAGGPSTRAALPHERPPPPPTVHRTATLTVGVDSVEAARLVEQVLLDECGSAVQLQRLDVPDDDGLAGFQVRADLEGRDCGQVWEHLTATLPPGHWVSRLPDLNGLP